MARVTVVLTLAALLSACGKERNRTISTPVVIRIGGVAGKVFDSDFVKHRYFFIDDPDTLVATSLHGRRVHSDELALFVDRNFVGGPPDTVSTEWAIVTPDGQEGRDTFKINRVARLTPYDDYNFVNFEGAAYPYLVLRAELEETWVLAVAYRLRDDTGAIVGEVGNYFSRAAAETLRLKMIRPGKQDVHDSLTEGAWASTRRLEMKNVYDLGARNIDSGSLYLTVQRLDGAQPDSLDGVSYLEALGLDLVNSETGLARENREAPGAARGPDGRIDRAFIDYDTGLLFLPDQRPFAPSCIDMNGAARCAGAENTLGFRNPGSYSPRRRALGWRRVGGPGPSGVGPLYGYHFEPIGADSAATEMNPDLYDRRDHLELFRKYYLAGYFLGPG